MKLGVAIIVALALTGCGDGKVDMQFNEATALSPAEHADWQRLRQKQDVRFNEAAKGINSRLKAAYLRGKQVCQNLKDAGYPAGKGCPRPIPNYVAYRPLRS